MDYFVSIYYNIGVYAPTKEACARAFLINNPWVTLIECVFGDDEFQFEWYHGERIAVRLDKSDIGFINNRLINDFIDTHDNIKSLTLIDCDLILYPDFRERVLDKLNSLDCDKPIVVQGFMTCSDEDTPGHCNAHSTSIMKYYKMSGTYGHRAHTGYVWTFNRSSLERIYPFPEWLVLGGFDTVMCNILIKCNVNGLYNDSGMFNDLLDDYSLQIGNVNDFVLDYVNGHIIHMYHGPKICRYANRLNIWYVQLYKHDEHEWREQVIRDYFINRRET